MGFSLAAVIGGCSSSDPAPAGGAGAPGAAGAHSAGAPGAGAPGAGAPGAGAGAPGAGAPGAGAGAPGAGAGAPGAGAGPMLTGNATTGATVYSTKGCSGCHGTNGEGAAGPNITGSMTAGIGKWTIAEFTAAVRSATNRKGAALCSLMAKSDVNLIGDQAMADMFAFLKSKPVDTAVAGSYCTPALCPGGCTGNL